jgi:hypothetical protein
VRYTRNIIPALTERHGFEPATDSGRKSGRMLVEGIKCNRGKLLDLSKSGAKLLTRRNWPEGEKRQIVLTGSRVQVMVTAECRRCEKLGMFRYVIGLQIVDCSANINAAMLELVRSHCRFLDEPEFL